ncbi:universal stress protein [Natronomonas salina]|uniref:universal stress protein n=1 Tax=Natronomonas salina TaxID=1710540 RepID=UPI0015B55BAD|nr:universal stress protein [Natronomonas salina]QLD89562.1 universal stress protein [Natronomonas salina]
MHERILVPTDGSKGTAHVAMQALDLGEQYGATVHFLYVVDSNAGAVLADASGTEAKLREVGERAVATLEELAEAYDVATVSEIRAGDPAEEILAYGDDVDADLVVMGTHGRSGIERRLIGSVAERVVRHSEQPVMTVRLSETDRTVTNESQAIDIVDEALREAGYRDIDVAGADQQRHVWVVEATADGSAYNVYVDPVTQRTSVVRRSDERVLPEN